MMRSVLFILKIILAFSCFINAALYINADNIFASVLLDRVVAIVNGEVITWSELRRAIELENRELLRGMEAKEKERRVKEIEKPFLDSLIDIKLQLQEARKTGLNVSPAEINDAVDDIKRKYNLTDEEFVRSLKEEGLTKQEYRDRLGEQILLSKVINNEVKSDIFISDKAVEEYYEANKERYSKERIKIRQIFLFKPKDEPLYKEMETKVQGIIKRIKKGEDFSELAREFSEDKSREFGGDLGYIERGSILKEIEDAAFSLKEGEVSSPFWSPAGLHIIKVEERLEGDGLDKVKEGIRKFLFEEAFQKTMYEEWIKELRERAYIEIKL